MLELMDNLKNMAVITTYIKDFGIWAPAIAFLLFLVQAALPIFPYIILATIGGLLFGFKLGVFLAWSGALAGACVAYWISRMVAADWLIDKLEIRFGYNIREMDSELAFWSIVLARCIPVIPTPLINVVAALGGVNFGTFFFSSAIGKIPTAILYTGLGICLFSTKDVKLAIIILVLIILLAVAGRILSKKDKIIKINHNDPDRSGEDGSH